KRLQRGGAELGCSGPALVRDEDFADGGYRVVHVDGAPHARIREGAGDGRAARRAKGARTEREREGLQLVVRDAERAAGGRERVYGEGVEELAIDARRLEREP